MNYLIDTNVLLVYLEGGQLLDPGIIKKIESEDNTIYVSAASLWEIAIKSSMGKVQLKRGFDETLALVTSSREWKILEIRPKHLTVLHSLPFHHSDPFDRLILAQSMAEGIELLHTDPVFDSYRMM